jgi:RHS repeat-associated protein
LCDHRNGRAADCVKDGPVGGSATANSYVYDPDGLRVQQDAGGTYTNYTIDPDSGFGDVIEDRSYNGTLEARYDYGDDLIDMQRSGGTSWYLFDGHGSTMQLASTAGSVTDSYEYDAYGDLLSHSGSTQNVYLYDAQCQDGTGLYYLRARYMDPSRGEFLGQDPFGGDDEDPVSLHRYLYCDDNAVMNEDESGKDDLGGLLVGIGIAGVLAGLEVGAIGTEKHADLEITEGSAWSYYFPDISNSLRAAVALIPKIWNVRSNVKFHQDAANDLVDPSLLDPVDAYNAWDIVQLTNTNPDIESAVGQDSSPQVGADQTDLHMVRVDGQTFHDYSANYVAYGAMMRVSGHARWEVGVAVDNAKSLTFYLDQSAAMAWALAGYDGWPDSARTPDSEIVSAGDSGLTAGLTDLDVHWEPFGLYDDTTTGM